MAKVVKKPAAAPGKRRKRIKLDPLIKALRHLGAPLVMTAFVQFVLANMGNPPIHYDMVEFFSGKKAVTNAAPSRRSGGIRLRHRLQQGAHGHQFAQGLHVRNMAVSGHQAGVSMHAGASLLQLGLGKLY